MPWIKSYPDGVRWDIEIEADAGAADPRRHRGEVAGPPGARVHGQADHLPRAARRSPTAPPRACRQLGVGPGVHVGLYLPNTPHYVIAFFGVLKAGGTVVNYSPLDAAKVLEHKIEDSRTDILVTLDLAALYPQMGGDARQDAPEEARRRQPGRDVARQPDAVAAQMKAGKLLGRGAGTTRRTCASPRCSTTTARYQRACDRRSARGDRGAAVHRRHDRPAEGRDADPCATCRRPASQYWETVSGTPPVLVEGAGARAGGAAAVPHLRAVGQHAARHPRARPS